MQQKPSRKLNSQFAIDFNLPDEVPAGLGEDRRFGRGFTIGAATGTCLVVGSLVNLYLSLNDPTRVARGIGYLLMSAGATFVFVILYHMVQRIGIQWCGNVLDPSRSPAKFWRVTVGMLVFFTLFFCGGVWLCVHAAWVAGHLS